MGKRPACFSSHGVAARIASMALVAAAAALVPPAALAQEPPATAADAKAALAKARSQFQQALALETAEDWAGALSLFQQVAAVRLTPQVRFHIGLCEEHVGRLAAALGAYKLAAMEAEQANAAEVAAQVASRLDELRARIPKVVIVRGKGAEYASISLDGVSLGAAAIGDDLPVDPGPHHVEARAPGYKPYSSTVQLAEKEQKKVEIVMESASASSPTPEATPPPAAEKAEKPKSKVVPFVIGGVGVASLAASGVFFILRGSAISKLEDRCPTREQCPADLQSTYDSGKMYSLLVPITLGVGVAAVGTAVILLVTQKKGSSAPPATASLQVEPLLPVAPGAPAGAVISGHF